MKTVFRKTLILFALVFGGAVGSAATPALFRVSAADEKTPDVIVSPEDPLAALEALETSLGLEDVRETFLVQNISPVAFGSVYRFRRAGEAGEALTLSVDKTGKLLSVNYSPDPIETIVTPASLSVNSTQTDGLGNLVEIPVYEEDGVYSLEDRTRNIAAYNANHGTSTFVRQTIRSSTGQFEDDLAVSAYASIVKAYDFYANADNIGVSYLGIDGQNDQTADNASTRGEVSVRILLHYDRNYENAFFEYIPRSNIAYLCIGDGKADGDLYRQAQATDVLAHEYQHGITQFQADLDYLNEAGAINEAMSDIFGALVEGHEPSEEAFWTTGENAVPADKEYLRSAIRLLDTTRFNTKKMFDLCYRSHDHTSCDSGGVHYNSSILTHFQYNLWRLAPQFFTRERIGTIWFTTLSMLTSQATFESFAEQFRLAAVELGYPEDVLSAIDECFYACGITADEGYHLVTFLDENGKAIDHVCVRDGETPLCPVAPEKKGANSTEYVFSGWSRDVSHVTGDMTVTAQYTTRARQFIVRFLNEDGTLLKEESVVYGQSATPPADPVKAATERIDYVFDGWSGGELGSVFTDLELTPRFREIGCFFVTFLDADGNPYKTVRVREGEDVVPPSPPDKTSDAQYHYTFSDWEGSLSGVTEDRTVRPLYSGALQTYTVTFRTADGERTEQYTYGQRVNFPEDAETDGWYLDEAFTSPAGDVTVTGDLTLFSKPKAAAEAGCGGTASAALYLPLLLPLLFFRKKRKALH